MASSQKAWSQGTNPITQRATNSGASNGVVNPPKSSGPTKTSTSSSKESSTPDKHANDRMTYLLVKFIGQNANVSLKNGEQYTGIFSGAVLDSSDNRFVLKMVKRIHGPSGPQVNGVTESPDDHVGAGEDHAMVFEFADIVDLALTNVVIDRAPTKSQNGVSSSFRTDADISGNLAIRERQLQPWQPPSDPSLEVSLDDAGKAGWDQFEANERLYGIKSNYDEHHYTTAIDRNNPLYKQRAAHAEKIAREIEASVPLNAHVAEERGHNLRDDGGSNEEDKYSGVHRDYPPLPTGQLNKYTPPARRPPTGQPTVPGAPVDPAIISSQLARPTPPPTKPTSPPATTPTEKGATAEASKPETAVKPAPAAAPAPSAAATTVASPATPSGKTLAAKEAPATEPKSLAQAKALVEPAGKTAAAVKPNVKNPAPPAAARNPGQADSRTNQVEHELLDQFKTFTAQEKLRLQERQRTMRSQDKAVKLNDLRKFAENFKLHTPVPQDLVPILAKDEQKQREIVAKAQKNVDEHRAALPPKPPPSTAVDQKPQARPAATRFEPASGTQATQADRQGTQRPRPNQGGYSSLTVRGDRPVQLPTMAVPPRQGPGGLGQRLQLTQQQHKAGTAMNIPQPVPIQDMRVPAGGASGASSGVQTPTSSVSTRFNAKASEFKPNPAANTFTPGGNPSTGSSPRVEPGRTLSVSKAPTASFFSNQKPQHAADRPRIRDAFNAIKRMKKEVEEEHKSKEFAANGGIPQAYRTPPTWDVPKENEERKYADMFVRTPLNVPHLQGPPMAVVGNSPMSHQHQLPQVPQGGPVIPHVQTTPHQTSRHPSTQTHPPGGPHHFEGGHHMQFSASTSSVQPSPRGGVPYVHPYSAVPQPMPMFQQGMPGYGMSPSMQHVALRQPGPGQFVPGQSPAMGGQVMMNQPSSGPFMPMPMNPQMQMYSPTPSHVYPHQQAPMPPPTTNGYSSPRPHGAQMMTHQGSQQGQPPNQMMYVPPGMHPHMFGGQIPAGPITPMRTPYPPAHHPHYQSSPNQPPHYPQHPHRGTPSAAYGQPMMPTHSMPPQGPPPAVPASHVPDGGEEVK